MPKTTPTTTADIASLDAARLRRHYIDLANAHWAWQEIKASWSLAGINVTDDNAEQAGRMIATGHSPIRVCAWEKNRK